MKTKKIISAVLSVAMAFSLSVGAFAATDAKASYQAMLEKTNQLKSLDGSMTMTMEMKKGDRSETVQVQMLTRMSVETPDDMQMSMKMKAIGANAEDKQMEQYLKDGYLYMVINGQKVKYKLPLEELKGLQSTMPGGDENNLYTNVRAFQQGTDTVYSLEVDSTRMNEVYQDVVKTLSSVSGMNALNSVDVKIGSISQTATANQEGYMTGNNIKMSLTMTIQGETYQVNYDINSVYYNPGQPVTVSFPDLSGYQDITSLMNGAA